MEASAALMNDKADGQSSRWFVRSESGEAGSDEIQELSEAQLVRRLRRAGDSLKSMFVKQGEGDWYPAHVVLKKFEQLAQDGIYVRRHGDVEGPFTASKAIDVLAETSLKGVQAKVGIHADWVSASRLLQRLQAVQRGSEGLPSEHNRPARSPAAAVSGAAVVDDPRPIEVVMVAEPVALPPQPDDPTYQYAAREDSAREAPLSRRWRPAPQAVAARRPPRREEQSAKHSANVVLLVAVGVLGLSTVAAGIGLVVLYRGSANTIAPSKDTTAAEVDSQRDASSDLPTAADGPPPVVGVGTLFRPSFRTSMGQAAGGTMFAARFGRSKRMVLVGAAQLLGPATGLKRQLRGAEVLMHLEGLEISDCVSGRTQVATGERSVFAPRSTRRCLSTVIHWCSSRIVRLA